MAQYVIDKKALGKNKALKVSHLTKKISGKMGITLLPDGESSCETIHSRQTKVTCCCAKIFCQACLESKGLVSRIGKPPAKKKRKSN